MLESDQDDIPAPKATVAVGKKVPSANPYIDDLAELERLMVTYADIEAEPCGDGAEFPWQPVLEQSRGNWNVKVQRRTGADFCYRVVADLESTPEQVFDILADAGSRASWDEVAETAALVAKIANTTKIASMRTKAYWPTASRDALVVLFQKRLKDRRYLCVTKSIPSYVGYESISGDVRMNVYLAGFVVEPHPSGDENLSRVVQIMNADLGGSLPSFVVSLVTTQAFPITFRNVNKILRKIEKPTKVSKFIEEAEGRSDKEDLAVKPVQKKVEKENIAPTTVSKKASTGAVPDRSSPILKAFKFIFKVLEKAQPFLVLALFVAFIFRRKWQSS